MSYTDAEGNVTTVQYDAQGNITSTTDALGNTTAYTYRKDGLLTEIKDASGAITLYEYDSKGRVAKETDALGAVTAYEYDAEDRVVKVTAPNGTITEYAYNTDGSITKVTAVNASGEVQELRYLYALDGSLTASISSTDILEYTYDKRGYVASVTKNNDQVVSLVYDGNGNLTLLKELEAGQYTPDSITGYSYDARGLLTEVYAGGTVTYKTTSYDRDGLPILTETVKDGELLASYLSRADGLLEQTTDGAGNVTKYQYNRQKQVTGLTITAADGNALYSEENSYDRNGSLLKQVVSGEGYISETLSYTYDALDRLVKETKNGATISYTYDSMGNRLTKTENGVTTSYVYDLCNKLLSETEKGIETTYTYDALGNLTEKVSSEGTTTYAYDALNQLTEVVNPDGTWQRNTYDASGIRSMIAENGVTTEFMTFNGLVLSGYNKDGEQTEHYYYGNSLLAVEYANADLFYYLKNSHGDVIGFTDNTGTLTETYRYDAFGTLLEIQSLNEDGILAKAETALSRFLYAGEQHDAVTGLYYLRARQYDTAIGRFTQEDTYLGDGRNLYVYVSNNPLKYVDPSGREKSGGYDKDINNLYIAMVEGTDPEAYMKYQEEHKGWYDAWDFVENTTEQICESIIEDTIESIGGNLDFASGYIDGLWSGVTQMPPKSKKYIFNEKAYDEGLVMGNLTVLTADTTMTILSAAGTGASATATVAATAGGGYVVVPEMVALTAVGATSTTYFAGRVKNDSSRLKDSVDELLDSSEDSKAGNTLTDAQKSRLNALDNTINDHLTDGDFSGTLRDLQGNPVPNGKGGYFNHLGEMQDSYKSLKKIKKALDGSLKNPNLTDVDRALLQEGLDKANSYINKIEDLFAPYGGIN